MIQCIHAWEGMLASRRSRFIAGATPGDFFILSSAASMKLFYLDESGNPELSGPSESYILTAISIPVEKWPYCDREINQLKTSYNMPEVEIHVAWMLRDYKEQNSVNGFEKMNADQRRAAVIRVREGLIEKCKRERDAKERKRLEKNFKNTEPYIHLTLAERTRFVYELAKKIKGWKFARLFAVIVNKKNYTPPKPEITPLSQAFERIVTKVECYLKHISFDNSKEYGLLIHDECEAAAASHKKNMRRYFRQGTFKSRITHIIETPLFVASEQTNMIQIADLCAYALRRYYDYGESDLYDIIKERADRAHDENIGFDHCTSDTHCSCEICRRHRKRRK